MQPWVFYIHMRLRSSLCRRIQVTELRGSPAGVLFSRSENIFPCNFLGFVLCVISFVLTCSCVNAQESAGVGRPVRVLARSHTSVPEKCFLIEGTNYLQNAELRRWAETVSVNVMRAVGLDLPCGDSFVIRITAWNDESVLSGRVEAQERISQGVLVRHLKVCNYEKINRVEADEALCRLLLGCYVAYRRPEASDVVTPTPAVTPARTNSVPRWLYLGMSRYIYSYLRARDVDVVLGIWKKGQVKPFPEFLDFAGSDKGYPYESVYGVMVAWIASLPDRQEIFGKIFEHLASGKNLSPDFFAKNIPGCSSAADVDEKWENWIISQWRVVYRLGVATPLQVEQLKEHLVLKQGDVGMPISSNISMRIDFKSLADMKPVDWLPVVLRNKMMELRILAMGKGKDFSDVVDSYCKFLDAVAARKKAGYILGLLENADRDFDVLAAKVSEGSGEKKGE